jgi:predicted DCC family thiol-disulfide oxidoreductase YuxK
MAGTLFFDGNCGMCTRAVYAILRWDRSGSLRAETLQSAGAPRRLGIPASRILDAARWLDDSGDVYSGAKAMNAAVSTAFGTRLPLLIYRIPAIRSLEDVVYRWIVRHRYRFPGTTPYCETHPVGC